MATNPDHGLSEQGTKDLQQVTLIFLTTSGKETAEASPDASLTHIWAASATITAPSSPNSCLCHFTSGAYF